MADNYHEKPGVYPSVPPYDSSVRGPDVRGPNVRGPDVRDPDVRDPNDINKHLRLDFFNVIAEPDESAYSCDVFHTVSNKVYQYSKLFIYRLLTVIVGLPLMLFWGLLFGIYTFLMIWLAVPARRLTQSAIAESGIYVQTASDAVIAPIFRSLGLVWSHVRVSFSNQTINSSRQVQV